MAAALILLTIGLPWLGALAVWRTGDQYPHRQHRLAAAFSMLAGVASLALLGFTSPEPAIRMASAPVFGDIVFVADGLAAFLTAVAAVIGWLAVVFSVDYMQGEKDLSRYYALVLLFIGAMAGLVLSGSLMMMFVFWEITALCSYALISFHNDDPKAVQGGIKALIITGLGGVGLLAGALLAHASLGSFEISDLLANASTLGSTTLALIAFGFLAAAAAKSAQFPFQTWLPGAMEAPTPVSALIHAATMVNAGVYLLARFYPAFADVPGWTAAVMVVGLISALTAAVMALASSDLKRVLAYSTISQLGYMFYAIGSGGLLASQFHLLSHAVFKALLFLGAGAVIHSVGTRDMGRMGGLSKEMPFTRTMFGIGAWALAGLPLANGFFSKEMILEAGLHGPKWAYIGMLVGAGITAIYTTRMMLMVFYGKPHNSAFHVHDAGSAMKFALGVLGFGTFTTWLMVGPFSRLLNASLPFHDLEVLTLGSMAREIWVEPGTWIAVGVIGTGMVIGLLRERFGTLTAPLGPLARFAEDGLGFELINAHVVSDVNLTASGLRVLHTGQMSWNVAGIIGGLIVLIAALVWVV